MTFNKGAVSVVGWGGHWNEMSDMGLRSLILEAVWGKEGDRQAGNMSG